MPNPHLLARHGAILAVRDDLSALRVSGPDRFSWLQALLTCDVNPVKNGQAVYGLVLHRNGKILADVFLIARDSDVLLVTDKLDADALLAHLDAYLVMEDADIEVLEPPITFVLAIGPQAPAIASAASNHPGIHASGHGTLLGTSAALLGGAPNEIQHILPSLLRPDDSSMLVSNDDFDALRVDLGFPKWHKDFDGANYPMEIGLDQVAISFQKGCYVGQEVVVKLRSRGKPVRLLIRLALDSNTLPDVGSPVSSLSGKEIGTITNVGYSMQKRALAFALVRRSEVEASPTVVVQGIQAHIDSLWKPFEG